MTEKPGGITRITGPAKIHILTPRGRLDPTQRVLASHRLVEQAAEELDIGDPGSGQKALGFALATNLALVIGAKEAAAFFQVLKGVAAQTVPPVDEPDDGGDAA